VIIADTGFFVALGSRDDVNHLRSIRIVDSLTEPLITTYPVITETAYLLATRVGSTAQISFLEALAEGAFEIFELQRYHLRRITNLMRQYADLPMDFADASLVVLAEHLGHGRILTVDDRDFGIDRWNNRNPFENVLQG
jgi:predicted nucleic acid-binding protein